MSNLSLPRGEVSQPALFALLKEMFRATPLGLVLASIARR
ncbi:MAG: hypothetical protein JWP60_3215 [Ramlibacter sp.]|jgi:hypothetical protein|nr:hypothetical protein [Ramlibacter sp.]